MRIKSVFLIVMTGLYASGCASLQGRPANDYCLICKPIYVTPADIFTDETAEQILENNETCRSLCDH